MVDVVGKLYYSSVYRFLHLVVSLAVSILNNKIIPVVPGAHVRQGSIAVLLRLIGSIVSQAVLLRLIVS